MEYKKCVHTTGNRRTFCVLARLLTSAHVLTHGYAKLPRHVCMLCARAGSDDDEQRGAIGWSVAKRGVVKCAYV